MTKKLTSFIENYLKNQKISDYESWLALYGEDSEEGYRKAKADADTAYAKARAENGARASSLYAKGLSGSGYSDFLTHAAHATRQNALSDALDKKLKRDAKNEQGYLSYIQETAKNEEKEKTAREKEERSIFLSLLSQRLLDERSAVTYLTMRGIDEERAKELARESIKIEKGSARYIEQLIDEAYAANMDYYSAYSYARQKGLDQKAAEEAATIAAYRVAKRKTFYPYGYYNY